MTILFFEKEKCKRSRKRFQFLQTFADRFKNQGFTKSKVEKERSDFLCFVTNKQQILQDESQTLLGSLLSRCKDITKNWILQTFHLYYNKV